MISESPIILGHPIPCETGCPDNFTYAYLNNCILNENNQVGIRNVINYTLVRE